MILKISVLLITNSLLCENPLSKRSMVGLSQSHFCKQIFILSCFLHILGTKLQLGLNV